jgi:NADPH-dependent 2,4-dienoyl-CoA reductase/sulfur reductase-like enzyme
MQRFDLVIVGTGPAGMAAAREAAEAGLQVALVDEQPRAGGQIYRDVERGAEAFGDVLGAEYQAGASLVNGIAHDNIEVFAGHTVWAIEEGRVALSSLEGGLQILGGILFWRLGRWSARCLYPAGLYQV